MDGFYHLYGRTPDRLWHYAKVSLRLDPAPNDSIHISDDAFNSRGYPNAPEVAQFKAEAIDGVSDALAELPADRPSFRVTLTRIEDAPLDTSPGDVRLASARATWDAFGRSGAID